jgi:uncharacterized Zn-finger protein
MREAIFKVIQFNTTSPNSFRQGYFEIEYFKCHNFLYIGEKPFQCDLCGRSFRQSGNLTKHLKSHENAHLRWNRTTNEKPFKCPHEGCDKSFTAKSSLQNHIRTHIASIEGLTAPVQQITMAMKTTGESSFEESKINRNTPIFAATKPTTIKTFRFHCIHPNCKKSFKDEIDLRAHLIAYNPGMAAENQFLRESILSLMQAIDKIKPHMPSVTNLVSECTVSYIPHNCSYCCSLL